MSLMDIEGWHIFAATCAPIVILLVFAAWENSTDGDALMRQGEAAERLIKAIAENARAENARAENARAEKVRDSHNLIKNKLNRIRGAR